MRTRILRVTQPPSCTEAELGWILSEAALCSGAGVLRGGTVLCTRLSFQRKRSQFILTLPPLSPDDTEQQNRLRVSRGGPVPRLPPPPPSRGFVGISFASSPRGLMGFSGCTCSNCPNTPVRVLERGEHRGLERWMMCSWLVLSPPPPCTSQDLRVWLRGEDPTGEPCGHHLFLLGEEKPRQEA